MMIRFRLRSARLLVSFLLAAFTLLQLFWTLSVLLTLDNINNKDEHLAVVITNAGGSAANDHHQDGPFLLPPKQKQRRQRRRRWQRRQQQVTSNAADAAASSEFATKTTTTEMNWLDAIVEAQYPKNNNNNSSRSTQHSSSSNLLLRVVYPVDWMNDPIIGLTYNNKSTTEPSEQQVKDELPSTKKRRGLDRWREWQKEHHHNKKQRLSPSAAVLGLHHHHTLLRVSSEVMHAEWKQGTRRHYGRADFYRPKMLGGRTVQGEWPDKVTGLTYIAILKNAHTFLMNTVGDLRQRLDGKSTYFKASKEIQPVMEDAFQRQRLHAEDDADDPSRQQQQPGHIVFAVVRNPVDRFLSGTCQDMSMMTAPRMNSLLLGCEERLNARKLSGQQHVTHEDAALQTLDCVLDGIQKTNTFSPHQTSQVSMLMQAVQNVHVGVTLIPQEMALPSLVNELGGHNIKSRDRTQDDVYKRNPTVQGICQLKADSLTDTQRKQICQIYKADVRMMELAGIEEIRFCGKAELLARKEQQNETSVVSVFTEVRKEEKGQKQQVTNERKLPEDATTFAETDSRHGGVLEQRDTVVQTARQHPMELPNSSSVFNNVSSPINWLDEIAAAQYALTDRVSKIKLVVPSEWKDDPIIGRFSGPGASGIKVMNARWSSGSGRYYGIDDKAVSESEGGRGRTVQGVWPEQLSQLTFIAIRKNAHTHLMNMMGDLRQRLDGTSTLVKSLPQVETIMSDAYKSQREKSMPRHAVFAVVRDPVSRFISSSCQDFSSQVQLSMKTCPESVRGHNVSALTDCIVSRLLQGGTMTHHQTRQVSFLQQAVMNVPVLVALIPQESAIASLIDELGGRNVKNRDRTEEAAYKENPFLESFCQLQTANLTSSQIKGICEIYKADVRMLELAGIEVPLCNVVSEHHEDATNPPSKSTGQVLTTVSTSAPSAIKTAEEPESSTGTGLFPVVEWLFGNRRDESPPNDGQDHDPTNTSVSQSPQPKEGQETTATNITNWLDAVVAAQFPSAGSTSPLGVVYPSEWKNDPILASILKGKRGPADIEVMHAHWAPGTKRLYGIQSKSVAEEEGGRTVHGMWPDHLSDLTLITVPKNAHTHLMNTMGDLRQRLQGVSKVYKAHSREIAGFMQDAYERQRDGAIPGHAVFAVVRNPVDRFLSSTCQDLSLNKDRLKGYIRKSCRGQKPLDIVDCLVSKLKNGGPFWHHQTPQISMIMNSVKSIPVGVTLIPMEKSISCLVIELGGQNVKNRDRTKEAVYKKTTTLSNFCQLKPSDLMDHQVASICEIYRADVYMMTQLAGIDVPQCQQPRLAPSG